MTWCGGEMVGYVSRLGIDLRAREILISRFGDRLEKEKEGKKKFWNWERERQKQRKELKKIDIQNYNNCVHLYGYCSNNVFLYKFAWFDDVSELCVWLAKMWSLYYFKLVGASALTKRRS